MVAQVDEQHAAMVADAVAPAREADGLADMVFAELAAGMGAIGVHGNPGEKGLGRCLAEFCPGVKGARRWRAPDPPPPDRRIIRSRY